MFFYEFFLFALAVIYCSQSQSFFYIVFPFVLAACACSTYCANNSVNTTCSVNAKCDRTQLKRT